MENVRGTPCIYSKVTVFGSVNISVGFWINIGFSVSDREYRITHYGKFSIFTSFGTYMRNTIYFILNGNSNFVFMNSDKLIFLNNCYKKFFSILKIEKLEEVDI